MQFWIFPLFGACYLSFFTFNKDASFLNVNAQKIFPNSIFDFFSLTSQNHLEEIEIKKSLQEILESNNFERFQPLSEQSDLVFFSNYSKKREKNLELYELERLWSLYSELTRNSTKVDSMVIPTFILENHLLESLYLKNSIFNWSWYPLQIDSTVHSSNLRKKLKFNNSDLIDRVSGLTFLNQRLNSYLKNPVIEYFQSSSIFDDVLKSKLMAKSVTVSDFFPYHLKKLNNLESLNLSFLKKQNSIFYFSLLLNELNKTAEEFTKQYTEFLENKIQLELYKTDQNSNFFSETSTLKFQKNFKDYYQFHFLKILLNSYFREVQIISKNNYRNQFKNLTAKSFKNSFFTSHLNQRKLTNRLRSILLYKTKEKNILFDNKKNLILTKLQLLNQLKVKIIEQKFNKNLHAINSLDAVRLKSLFYNINILQNWSQVFQLNNLKFNNSLANNNLPQFQNSRSLGLQPHQKNYIFKNIKTPINKTEDKKNSTLILFKQLYLYNKLKNLSNLTTNFTEPSLNGVAKDLKSQIVKFQRPLLFTNLNLKETKIQNRKDSLFLKSFSSPDKTSVLNSQILQNQMGKSIALQPVKTLVSKTKEHPFQFENQINQVKNSEKSIKFIKNILKNYSITSEQIYGKRQSFLSYPNNESLSNFKKFDITKVAKNTLKSNLYLQNNEVLKLSNTKWVKKMNKFKFQRQISVFNKRKSEKIFRLYSSIKNSQDTNFTKFKFPFSLKYLTSKNPKEQNLQRIFFLLQQVKKNMKKDVLLKSYVQNHSSYSTVKGFKTLKSFNSSNNFFKLGEKPSIKSSFSEKIFLKQLGLIQFFKKSNLDLLNTSEKNYLEKHQVNQKKRRLKKLKLETRRRKKRKRFYPRPFYLRSNLYVSFLQKRHSLDSLKSDSSFSFFRYLHENNLNNSNILKNKIYRQNRQKWGILSQNLNFVEKSNLQKFMRILFKPDYHQQELYKISNKTLTEFEKLSWKSYWLKSNLKPYVLKIKHILQQLKDIETLKSSKNLSFNFLQEKPSFQKFQKIKNREENKNLIPLYLNINYLLQNPTLPSQSFNTSEQLSHKMNYDSFLYDRITDEIKNVKSQLNIDGNIQARSYKPGRQKVEKTDSPSLFSFFPQMNHPLKIQIHDRFQKPIFATSVDDLPTLRLLWGFHKTNLFQIKENNFSRIVWEGYKNREKMKSNKTRKFISTLLRNNLKFQSEKDLQTLSARKIEFSEKKLNIFGQFMYKKNYNQYLRTLKFKLIANNPSSIKVDLNTFTKFNNILLDQYSQDKFLTTKQNFFTDKLWFNTLLINKLQKPILNFWWSNTSNTPVDSTFSTLVFNPSVNFPNLDSYLINSKNQISSPFEGSFLALTERFNKPLILTTFWISCCLLHIALLFTLIRIPEVRSLIKFQLLVFIKLTNIYLIGLSSLYNLFQTYKTKLSILIRKFPHFSILKSESFSKDKFFLILKENEVLKREATVQKTESTFNYQPLSKQVILSVFTNSLDYPSKKNLKKWQNNKNLLFQSTLRFKFLIRDFNTKFEKTRVSYPLNPNFNFLRTQTLSSTFKKANIFTQSKQGSLSHFYSSQSQTLWYNISNSLFSTSNLFFQKKTNFVEQARKTSNVAKGRTLAYQGSKNLSFNRLSTKFQLVFSLSSLYLMKVLLSSFYISIGLFYKVIFKIIDGFETILLIFYKFLEKPAEVMVNWIAEFFLIEWSSNLIAYIPEIFDQQIWNSFFKFSRSSRIFLPVFSSFFIQRYFLNTFQTFYFSLYKQDMDLLMRQKKGIIFWDIWAEILIQAAEKYKMNLSSLSTIKEEQELLIENLVKDTQQKSKLKTSSNVLSNLTINIGSFIPFLNNYPSLILSENRINLQIPSQRQFSNITGTLNSENVSLKSEQIFELTSFENQRLINLQKRWSANQYLTTQGRDTDLFMDINPPKSFFQLKFLKNYIFSHELLGSLTCEIYSGLFLQKISKNLLIIGPSGTSKTFFIQALAGETELKIVTDNARRYSLVQGGVPVGMKLLRDVFDSIVLHSPCLFLLEDIHIIGERRPNLMSDDEVLKSKDLTFGAEQEEVHEKNRMIYQISRHSISHYKRPYKGDFSFAIPTNHFCYDLFLGIQPPRKRRSDLTAKSPLPLVQIEKNLEDLDTSKLNNKISEQRPLISLLQTSLEQFFAPPSTSPFNILLLKEQKKLKPYKIVYQMPWSGLSYDQFILISKSNYSIRTKVALLAEIAMNSLTVKLDMITDLLVIVDSVRSNHGFVVFATTHLPSLLDPALRRPGRFDETIHLPNFPSLLTRFEILKIQLINYASTIDFLDYSFANSDLYKTNAEIDFSISKTLGLLFNTKQDKALVTFTNQNSIFSNFFNDYPIYSLSQAFYTSFKLPLFNIPLNKYKKVLLNQKIISQTLSNQKLEKKETLKEFLNSNQFYSLFKSTNQLNYMSLNYGQAGQFLVNVLLTGDHQSYLLNNSTSQFKTINESQDQLNFMSFYYSSFQSKNYLLKLFSGKFSEFFALNSFSKNPNTLFLLNEKQKVLKMKTSPTFSFNKDSKISHQSFKNRQCWSINLLASQKNIQQNSNFENIQNFQTYWQSALIFLESFFQKRYLYNKNSVVSKLLFFENFVQLRQPPSPPNSSILKPARQFENYKRTLKEFTEKPLANISEKIRIHQNQRFLKVLYNVSIQKSFTHLSKEKTSNIQSGNLRTVDFSNSFKELSYLDFLTLKPSSSYKFYKKNILIRQRFQFLNQWWNGQLPEHTVESTYLSHIDWRSMFIESLGDFVIDFPDAEQYYNPKNRRWFLNSKSWAYWLDFEETYKNDISNYFIFESLITTYEILNLNRELLDSLTFAFLSNSRIKEIDLVNFLIRFYKTSKT